MDMLLLLFLLLYAGALYFHLCKGVLYYYFVFAALAWFLHLSIFSGKMGASLHRSSKGQAIGGKPPYLRVNLFKPCNVHYNVHMLYI